MEMMTSSDACSDVEAKIVSSKPQCTYVGMDRIYPVLRECRSIQHGTIYWKPAFEFVGR